MSSPANAVPVARPSATLDRLVVGLVALLVLILLRHPPQEPGLLASMAVLHLGLTRDRDWRRWVAVGVLLACLSAAMSAPGVSWLLRIGAVSAAASLVTLAWDLPRLAREDPAAARRRRTLLLGTLVLPIAGGISTATVGQAPWVPAVVDPLLDRLDAGLGMASSVHTWMHLTTRTPWLATLLAASYLAIPSLLAYGFVARYHHGGPASARTYLAAMALAGALAVVGYLTLPAVGPVYARPGYPDAPWPTGTGLTTTAPLELLRSTVPSMHFGWALLLAVLVWPCGRTARGIGSGFAVLTALATLGLGQHYAIDLLLALPLVLAIGAGASRRWAVAGPALGVGVVLFALLRWVAFAPTSAGLLAGSLLGQLIP